MKLEDFPDDDKPPAKEPHRISVIVGDEETDAIEQAAKLFGLKPGAWLRSLGLTRAMEVGVWPPKARKTK